MPVEWFADSFSLDDNVSTVNLYCEKGNVAVSDNHRMAYYFFAKHAPSHSTLVHIDAHNDCGYFQDHAMDATFNLEENNLEDFIHYRYKPPRFYSEASPVRWGNWITALLKKYPAMFHSVRIISRQRVGPLEKKELPQVEKADCMENVLHKTDCSRFHFSIDIDYYYQLDDNSNGSWRSSPDEAISHFKQYIKTISQYRDALLFIALSPSCCGGWKIQYPLVDVIDNFFGFSLLKNIRSKA